MGQWLRNPVARAYSKQREGLEKWVTNEFGRIGNVRMGNLMIL